MRLCNSFIKNFDGHIATALWLAMIYVDTSVMSLHERNNSRGGNGFITGNLDWGGSLLKVYFEIDWYGPKNPCPFFDFDTPVKMACVSIRFTHHGWASVVPTNNCTPTFRSLAKFAQPDTTRIDRQLGPTTRFIAKILVAPLVVAVNYF